MFVIGKSWVESRTAQFSAEQDIFPPSVLGNLELVLGLILAKRSYSEFFHAFSLRVCQNNHAGFEQVSVHGDEPSEVNRVQFCRFLVETPLVRETAGGMVVKKKETLFPRPPMMFLNDETKMEVILYCSTNKYYS